jgi:cytochrome c553
MKARHSLIGAAMLGALANLNPARGQTPDAQCVACHGANGEGNLAMASPRIAAQPADYLLRQLDAFAGGARQSAVMAPIAKALTPDQRKWLANSYSTRDAPARPAGGAASERGRRLATLGDEKLHVQACGNCHGPDGIGEPPRNPYLAGQFAKYLGASLQEWKSGTRRTDPSLQMPVIAKRLPAADISALARYYAALRPPAPLALATPGPRPAPLAGPPTATTEAVKGVGVEQGSPTTGGSQGPGGGGAASGSGAQGTPPEPKR